MKSYNVKSNAKRFARGLCAKFEAFEPFEPIAVDCGQHEWWPAVQFKTWAVVGAVPLEVASTAAILTPDGKAWVPEAVRAAMSEGDAGVYENPTEDMSALADAAPASDVAICSECFGVYEAGLSKCPLCGAVDLAAEPEDVAAVDVTDKVGNTITSAKLIQRLGVNTGPIYTGFDPADRAPVAPRPVPGKDEPNKPKPLVVTGDVATNRVEIPIDAAALAAALPPPTKSTPEEISARREARRQRIEAGHYREDAPEHSAKETKGQIILRMASQEDGATAEAIASECGWQAHTLRGYIGGTLRKRLAPLGKTILAVRAKGEATKYKIAALE